MTPDARDYEVQYEFLQLYGFTIDCAGEDCREQLHVRPNKVAKKAEPLGWRWRNGDWYCPIHSAGLKRWM